MVENQRAGRSSRSLATEGESTNRSGEYGLFRGNTGEVDVFLHGVESKKGLLNRREVAEVASFQDKVFVGEGSSRKIKENMPVTTIPVVSGDGPEHELGSATGQEDDLARTLTSAIVDDDDDDERRDKHGELGVDVGDNGIMTGSPYLHSKGTPSPQPISPNRSSPTPPGLTSRTPRQPMGAVGTDQLSGVGVGNTGTGLWGENKAAEGILAAAAAAAEPSGTPSAPGNIWGGAFPGGHGLSSGGNGVPPPPQSSGPTFSQTGNDGSPRGYTPYQATPGGAWGQGPPNGNRQENGKTGYHQHPPQPPTSAPIPSDVLLQAGADMAGSDASLNGLLPHVVSSSFSVATNSTGGASSMMPHQRSSLHMQSPQSLEASDMDDMALIQALYGGSDQASGQHPVQGNNLHFGQQPRGPPGRHLRRRGSDGVLMTPDINLPPPPPPGFVGNVENNNGLNGAKSMTDVFVGANQGNGFGPGGDGSPSNSGPQRRGSGGNFRENKYSLQRRGSGSALNTGVNGWQQQQYPPQHYPQQQPYPSEDGGDASFGGRRGRRTSEGMLNLRQSTQAFNSRNGVGGAYNNNGNPKRGGRQSRGSIGGGAGGGRPGDDYNDYDGGGQQHSRTSRRGSYGPTGGGNGNGRRGSGGGGANPDYDSRGGRRKSYAEPSYRDRLQQHQQALMSLYDDDNGGENNARGMGPSSILPASTNDGSHGGAGAVSGDGGAYATTESASSAMMLLQPSAMLPGGPASIPSAPGSAGVLELPAGPVVPSRAHSRSVDELELSETFGLPSAKPRSRAGSATDRFPWQQASTSITTGASEDRPILPQAENGGDDTEEDSDNSWEDYTDDVGPDGEDGIGYSGRRHSLNASTNRAGNRSSPRTKKREWLLRMNRKLAEIPVGDLDPTTIPISAIMNAWAKTKSSEGAAMVEMWLSRAQDEQEANNTRPGVQPTTKMYTMAVDAWAKSGEGGKAAQKAEGILQYMNSLYQSGNHDNLKPTTGIFNAVINSWARSKEKIAPVRAEQILDWMDKLHRRGNLDIKPDKYTFNTVIHAWAKSGGKEAAVKAQKLLDNMHKIYKEGNTSAKPDTITYNVVINAWAKSMGKGAAQEAEKLLSKMHELHENGDPDVKPNVVTYGAVIDAYAKSMEPGAAARADSILANMIKLHQSDRVKNADLRPNTYVFNTVINCWAKSKEPDAASKAEEMLVAMDRLHASGIPGLKPDAFTYTAVIDAWAKSGYRGAASRADELLDKMEAKYLAGDTDLKPNTFTYNAVINALAKSGESGAAARAERVLQNMVNRNRTVGNDDVKPTTINFNTVLDAWAKSGGGRAAAERAEEILEWMDRLNRAGNPDVKPDTITFNAVIDAWARSGDKRAPQRAEQILDHMDDLWQAGNKDVKPDTYTYNTLINTWAKSGAKGAAERAECILSIMEQRYHDGDSDFKPNTRTHTSVIDAWAKSGEPGAAKRAEHILNTMQRLYESSGDTEVKPNVHTANAVMNACAFTKVEEDRAEALTIAFRVFDWLSSQPEMHPDAYTFTILLSVCSNLLPREDRATRFAHAQALFEKCCEAGHVNDYVLRKLRQAVTDEEYLNLVGYRGGDASAVNMPPSWTRNARLDSSNSNKGRRNSGWSRRSQNR